MPLPIDSVIPEIAQALRQTGAVALQAPPGAGKTTQVPPSVAAIVEGVVLVVEPRRMAARAAARRVAQEQGCILGEAVGYQVRFDDRTSPATRIVFVTEGVLLARLQRDPFLEGVGAVVLDEFHERRLDADLALALVATVRREVRDDLALVVMSATFDPTPVARWLGAATTVRSEGRTFPVEVQLLPRSDDRPLPEQVADGVRRALADDDGDVLAFLPGMRDQLDTQELLHDVDADVLLLHGSLPPEVQDQALRAGPRRRVVLSTNVAEASVTVPGVTTVVDAGLARVPWVEPATGLPVLRTLRIGRASADQRAGRAGRVRPGRCLRLWTEREDAALAPEEVPEIQRADLASAVLQLLVWGQDPERLDWFEAPPAHAVEAAEALLVDLGAAVRRDGALAPTAIGRDLARWPLHPRLGRMRHEAHRLGHGDDGDWLATLLSEGDPDRDAPYPTDRGDWLQRIDAARRSAPKPFRQVVQALTRHRGPAAEASVPREEALARALLAGWPDRVVRRREQDPTRGRMVGGKGVFVRRGQLAPLSVAVDVEHGAEALLRRATSIESAWLPVVDHLHTEVEDGKARTWAERRYRDLVLARHPAPLDREAAPEALASWAARHLDRVQPTDRDWPQLLGRWRAAHRWDPEVPDPDEHLLPVLRTLCAEHRSVGELQRADWAAAVRDTLGWPLWSRLNDLAPARIDLADRSFRLDWTGERPVLAARIQQLLGVRTTPTVGPGEPVLLHLLAPNQRVQQITDDLAGFWTGSYPAIRKELRARYPKHAWPETP